MCLCLNMLDMHGHGRGKRLGTCLVLKLRASCVVSLQHVSMFQYAGCTRAWTMQAPWYMSCASAVCILYCKLVACAMFQYSSCERLNMVVVHRHG